MHYHNASRSFIRSKIAELSPANEELRDILPTILIQFVSPKKDNRDCPCKPGQGHASNCKWKVSIREPPGREFSLAVDLRTRKLIQKNWRWDHVADLNTKKTRSVEEMFLAFGVA